MAGLGREKQGITSPLAALGNLRKSGLGLEIPYDGGAPAAKKSRKQQKRKQPQRQAAWSESGTAQPVAMAQQAPHMLQPGPASLAVLPLPCLPLSCLPHAVQHHAGGASTTSGLHGDDAQQLCQLALQENAALRQQMQALQALLHQQQQARNVSKKKRQKVAVPPPEPQQPVSNAVLTQQMLVLRSQLQQQQQAARVRLRQNVAKPPALDAVLDTIAILEPQSSTVPQPRESKKARRAQKLADRAERKAMRKAEQEVRWVQPASLNTWH